MDNLDIFIQGQIVFFVWRQYGFQLTKQKSLSQQVKTGNEILLHIILSCSTLIWGHTYNKM